MSVRLTVLKHTLPENSHSLGLNVLLSGFFHAVPYGVPRAALDLRTLGMWSGVQQKRKKTDYKASKWIIR